MNEPRYIVTELWGYPSSGSSGSTARQGVSAQVIDTAWNHRIVAMYSSDAEIGRYRSNEEKTRRAIKRASRCAALLNTAESASRVPIRLAKGSSDGA